MQGVAAALTQGLGVSTQRAGAGGADPARRGRGIDPAHRVRGADAAPAHRGWGGGNLTHSRLGRG